MRRLYGLLGVVIIAWVVKPGPPLELEMRRRLLSALFAVLLCATPLVGQTYYDVPQEVKITQDRSIAWEWLMGSIFLVGCLVLAFKPARRADLR